MSPYVSSDPVRGGDRVLAWGLGSLMLALFTLTMASPLAGRAGADRRMADHAGCEAIAEGVGSVEKADAGEIGAPWFQTSGPVQHLVGLPLMAAGSVLGRAFPDVAAIHARSFKRTGHELSYGSELALIWRGPLLAALTAVLVLLAARRLHVERPFAWFAALSYGLSTFAWPQSMEGLDDGTATFLLFLSFYLLLRIRARLAQLEYASILELAALGSCLGLTVMTRSQTLLAVFVLCAATEVIMTRGYAVLRETPWGPNREGALPGSQAALAIVLPLLGTILGGSVFQMAMGQAWRPAGFAFWSSPGHLLSGIAGLLISPGHGLIWMAPLVLLVPVGFARIRRRGERLTERVLVGVFLATLLPAAANPLWHGGWTYGPRLLLPSLPFLWLAVALGLRRSQGGAVGRAAVAGLFALGSLIQVAGVLTQPATHLDLVNQANEQGPGFSGDPAPTPAEDSLNWIGAAHWDLSLAAPWVHLRILRQRVAGLGEGFDPEYLWGRDDLDALEPSHPQLRGFGHLAWVDLGQRLDGVRWPVLWILVCLVILGVWMSAKGLGERGC